ncbi:MAG: DMSO/selenate family reductase complex A subunit [Bacillota bacterium]
MENQEKVIVTSGGHNCGGRCLLHVHVRGNTVASIKPISGAMGEEPQRLLPCVRCSAYKERLYHPDRLKYPLKRVGKRGEGKFARISWAEATDIIARELRRITQLYGPESRYINYSTGISGKLAEREFFRRLLCIYGGGYLNYHNSYSSACTRVATSYTYGTDQTGSSRDNWLYSKLIILWGHNPAETVFGTNTFRYLKQAKAKGARIIVIDPRYSDTASVLADQWIPILPTTDNALMDAMTYVMITENLYDRDFVEKFCLGFDEGQMPEGIPEGNSLSSYILGQTDGVPKTPEWAEKITRVPADTIRQLARDYAASKPAALIQGWGPQRHAYGEQPVRGATVLAAITGNVGILGGWASGAASYARVRLASIPYRNPVRTSIPVFMWPDAILRGTEMGTQEGVMHAGRLASNIKFLASLGGNCLINQHSDINLTRRVLEDETKCEFILVADEFMTSSARFADLLLPSTNFLERIDIVAPWEYADYVIFQNKAVEAEFERRTGYDWITEVAEKLGVKAEFTEGKSYEDWGRFIVEKSREAYRDFPSFEEFSRCGIYRPDFKKPLIAFQEQVKDPEHHPFPTPSGKIEIFSQGLYEMKNPREIPAIPKYIPRWEGPSDPLKDKYPLQLIGWHSKRSTHSIFANLPWAEKVVPLEMWINSEDADAREIQDGDRVRVFNSRGELEIKVKVTSRILSGVVAIPQGAWYSPDEKGVDKGGCINVLTRYHPTPLAKGNPQHINLVEVAKIRDPESVKQL